MEIFNPGVVDIIDIAVSRIQLAAVHAIGAGAAQRTCRHVGDFLAARVHASGGHARPAGNRQPAVVQGGGAADNRRGEDRILRHLHDQITVRVHHRIQVLV